MYTDAKDLLRSVVEWLEGTDQAGWDDQICTAKECLSVMNGWISLPDQTRTGTFGEVLLTDDPIVVSLNRAMPEVAAMLSGMHIRNRAVALKHGRAALSMM